MSVDSPTSRLSEFVSSLRFDRIPKDVVERTKDLALDYIRLGLLGSQLRWGRAVYEYVRSFNARRDSSILFYGDKTLPQEAAFVNGTFSHGLEWDDIHSPAILHPGVVVWPTALAIGEKLRVDGRRLITSVVAGYDAMIRTGLAIQPSHFSDRGFHGTATLGCVGAVATAGSLLGFDPGQMENAFGLAASFVSGLAEFFLQGSDVKRIHAGKAAHSGIVAAELTRVGITSPDSIFESELGLFRAFSDRHDSYQVVDGLGERFTIMEVSIKTHGSGRHLQSPLDGFIKLRRENGFSISDIDSIIVGTAPISVERLFHYEPRDTMNGQLSIPYALGVLLHKDTLDYLDFEDFDENIKNPDVLKLARLVTPAVDSQITEIAPDGHLSRVTVKLKSGKTLVEAILNPKGDPENPFTRIELQDRLIEQTKNIIPTSKILESIEFIQNLEKLDDITEIIIPIT